MPPNYRTRFDHRIHKVIGDCCYTNQPRGGQKRPGTVACSEEQRQGPHRRNTKRRFLRKATQCCITTHDYQNHEIDLQHNSPSKCMVARSASMFAWRSWIWGLPALHCCWGAVSVSVHSEYRSNIDGLSERVREMG